MKQLTCEMCGSTELIKQDGFFVCQTCGCKYSVEEAKKMMIEGVVQVSGGVEVKNAAQLENLLNLAQSSFESKNYAQAEEFCNQVIAIDAKNYTAWKLKGEAINYQITSNNPRILEVYNCIMTSYDILNDEEKEWKKFEVLSSLKTCFEGEIDFWVKQFEANRPTEAALNKVKSSYVDSYNKMAESFTKLGFSETKQGYLNNFDNYFIGLVNRICVSAWKTTVGYNYYRDKYKNGKWTDDNYRPMDETFRTFINEGDCLISLLYYAAEQFNDTTDSNDKATVYNNIAFIHEELCNASSFKPMIRTTTVYGYTSSREYWEKSLSLTREAKASRNKKIEECKAKAKSYKDEAIQRKRDYDEKKKNERIAAYWEKHSEEKEKLDSEKNILEPIREKCTKEIAELQKSKEKVPSLELLVKKQKEIESVEAQKRMLGLFKFNEKKILQTKIEALTAEKSKLKIKVNEEQQEIEKEIIPIRTELNKTLSRIKQIEAELTKDRPED